MNKLVATIYTHQAYDLDDTRKATRRAERHERLSTLIEMIQGLSFVDELIDQAEQEGDQSKLEKSRRLHEGISKAFEIIKLYAPVPHDAPTQCRCKTTAMHSLPEEFAKQIMQISSFP